MILNPLDLEILVKNTARRTNITLVFNKPDKSKRFSPRHDGDFWIHLLEDLQPYLKEKDKR